VADQEAGADHASRLAPRSSIGFAFDGAPEQFQAPPRSFDPTIRKPIIEEHVVNWDQIEGKWKQVKGRAQQKWGRLTDGDLDVIEGGRNELVGKIQERYGVAREKAEKEVDDWRNSLS
jgi:uncharacterized protein YjbJ (UPF0337 family)